MFDECDILHHILNGIQANEQAIEENGFKARLGYMGHLVQLSNMINKESKQEIIGKASNAVTEWSVFVNGTLAQMNADQQRILGGPAPIQAKAIGIVNESVLNQPPVFHDADVSYDIGDEDEEDEAERRKRMAHSFNDDFDAQFDDDFGVPQQSTSVQQQVSGFEDDFEAKFDDAPF